MDRDRVGEGDVVKLIIDQTTYTALAALTFAPQVSMTADTLPVNEFSADIITDDDIAENQYAELRDDLNNLWAKYVILYSDRVNETTVRIRAQSEVALLERVDLDAVLYEADALGDVLDDVMVRQSGAGGIVAPIDYELAQSLASVTVTGYAPKQNARERLQWVLFASGAFLQTAFVTKPTIMPVDDTPVQVPKSRIFWRPAVEFGSRVTAIKATAYTFTASTETQSELLDAESYAFPSNLTVATQEFTLDNPAATSANGDNIVEVKDVYLINAGNVTALLNRLAARYFNRESVDVDVINNRDYLPGEMLIVYDEQDSLYRGHVESMEFSFGLQARARMHMVAADELTGATLTVNYTYNNATLKTEQYILPVGIAYSVATNYIDLTDMEAGVRRVYRPTLASVTGTMVAAGVTATVPCEVALKYEDERLTIYSVDAIENQDGTGAIS